MGLEIHTQLIAGCSLSTIPGFVKRTTRTTGKSAEQTIEVLHKSFVCSKVPPWKELDVICDHIREIVRDTDLVLIADTYTLDQWVLGVGVSEPVSMESTKSAPLGEIQSAAKLAEVEVAVAKAVRGFEQLGLSGELVKVVAHTLLIWY